MNIRLHQLHTPLRYKHFCFIVVSELVMPVVIFPCCGDSQCRQKPVSYNYHHSHPNNPQHILDHGCFMVSCQQQRFPKFSRNRKYCNKSHLGCPLKMQQDKWGRTEAGLKPRPLVTGPLFQCITSVTLLSRYTNKPYYNALLKNDSC